MIRRFLLIAVFLLASATFASEPSPPISAESIYKLQEVLREIPLPASVADVLEQIQKVVPAQLAHGGDRKERSFNYYTVGDCAGGYLEVEMEHPVEPSRDGSFGARDKSMVVRLRLVFRSDLGLSFHAPALGDLNADFKKEWANKRPEGTSANAPPSNPSQGAAVPHP
jgi:hypothetical protein